MLLARALLTGLALFASAQAQVCSPTTAGSTAGRRVTLSSVTLAPGNGDYDVNLPDGCYPSVQIGTTLTACDNDVSPTATLQDLRHGHVHRNGNFAAEQGLVSTVVYCQP